jgi:signal transduction histidine kinase
MAIGDASALRRVLCSLVENSIKYTPDGGQITLSARSEGEEIVIRVTDNGCGIKAADVPHVFEKFYRGRPSETPSEDGKWHSSASTAPGIGLGLYLARTIVEESGGRIYVEASDDRGTTVAIHLPALLESIPTDDEQVVATATYV